MFLLEFLFPKKINHDDDSFILIFGKNEQINYEEYSYVLRFEKSKMSWTDRFFCFIFRKEMIYCEKKVELEVVEEEKACTAFEYLMFIKKYGHLPMSTEKPSSEASNSEIKRWLKSSSVIINGKKPKMDDEIELPITELIFFPKGKRKTTMI